MQDIYSKHTFRTNRDRIRILKFASFNQKNGGAFRILTPMDIIQKNGSTFRILKSVGVIQKILFNRMDGKFGLLKSMDIM